MFSFFFLFHSVYSSKVLSSHAVHSMLVTLSSCSFTLLFHSLYSFRVSPYYAVRSMWVTLFSCSFTFLFHSIYFSAVSSSRAAPHSWVSMYSVSFILLFHFLFSRLAFIVESSLFVFLLPFFLSSQLHYMLLLKLRIVSRGLGFPGVAISGKMSWFSTCIAQLGLCLRLAHFLFSFFNSRISSMSSLRVSATLSFTGVDLTCSFFAAPLSCSACVHESSCIACSTACSNPMGCDW